MHFRRHFSIFGLPHSSLQQKKNFFWGGGGGTNSVRCGNESEHLGSLNFFQPPPHLGYIKLPASSLTLSYESYMIWETTVLCWTVLWLAKQIRQLFECEIAHKRKQLISQQEKKKQVFSTELRFCLHGKDVMLWMQMFWFTHEASEKTGLWQLTNALNKYKNTSFH